MLIEENKRDCILDNFKLINQKEIIDFIRSNTGLLELIEKEIICMFLFYLNTEMFFRIYRIGTQMNYLLPSQSQDDGRDAH